MDKFIKLINLFAPYINTFIMISYIYNLFKFNKERTEVEELESKQMVRWKSHSLRRLYRRMVYFHFFSFMTVFLNRIQFYQEDVNNLIQFALFFVLTMVAISLILIITKRLFKGGEVWIIYPVLFLMDIGFVMIYRLQPDWAIKQLQMVGIGIVLMFFVPLILHYIKEPKKLAYLYIIASILLVIATLIIGVEKYGAKNWIGFGPIVLQPSEFIKILFVFYLASVLSITQKINKLIFPGILAGVLLGLFVIQKDLGSVLIFSITMFLILYASGVHYGWISALIGVEALGAVGAALIFSHVQRRIEAWINPFADVPNVGYQVAQGLFAIASGGLFGMGLMMGTPTKIPIVETDYIFAAICEELGVLFALGIIFIFMIIAYQIIRKAGTMENTFVRLLVVGLSSMLSVQAFVIIGGVIKLIPLTGVTLPFISYGGSSMISSLLFIALILYYTQPQHVAIEGGMNDGED